MLSKRRARMMEYCGNNPLHLYVHYDESLPDEWVNLALTGNFDSLWEKVWESVMDYCDYPETWEYWESDFAKEFGYSAWDDMPEKLREWVQESRHCDESEYVKDLCRNTRVHVNAVLLKRDGELIYAPAYRGGADDAKAARYIRDAFGLDCKPSEVAGKLECVYGGYDTESAVVIGTISGRNLWQIIESEKAPSQIEVGPRDSDNLLWYEFYNGAGNLGGVKIGKTRKFNATFHVDGTRGYGIDSCYGFCGHVWAHELKVTA
jgi:hypothetical protein